MSDRVSTKPSEVGKSSIWKPFRRNGSALEFSNQFKRRKIHKHYKKFQNPHSRANESQIGKKKNV